MENKIEFLIGDELTPLDEAIILAKQEVDKMDFNNKELSIVEMMAPYTKYTTLLWIKMNKIIENGKKEGRNNRSEE